MRWLVDNACSPQLAQGLRDHGHDAVHVKDYGIETAEDRVLLDRAKSERRILISSDTDFGTLLAFSGSAAPSVVLYRRKSQRHPSLQLKLLLENLPTISPSLIEGSMVVIEETRIRIHPLPFSRPRNEGTEGVEA